MEEGLNLAGIEINWKDYLLNQFDFSLLRTFLSIFLPLTFIYVRLAWNPRKVLSFAAKGQQPVHLTVRVVENVASRLKKVHFKSFFIPYRLCGLEYIV